jgi:hypothetical protein
VSLIAGLDQLKEDEPMNFFVEASKVLEAYCIEHNLPCDRHYTHDQLEDAIQAVRQAHQQLYGQPAPAEACTDL